MEPKLLLIVKVASGLAIRDTPRPQSKGGVLLRNVPVGKALYAYNIIEVDGVPYARLVPQIATKPEWVRVREVDSSVVYVDVIAMDEPEEGNDLVRAIRELTAAIRSQK